MLETKLKLPALLCAVGLALSACSGETQQVEGDKEAVTAEAAEETSSETGSEKVDAYNIYVGAHNDIVGMFYGSTNGIDNLLEDYKQQQLGSDQPKANKNVGPVMYLNTSMLRNMLEKLDEASKIKIGGDFTGLEAASAKLLVTGKQLQQQATDLEAYFKSKKYLDDHFAQAKTDDPVFVKQWEQFNAEYAVFNAELSKVEKTQRLASIAQFEQDGKMREAAQEKSFLAANEVLELLGSEADTNNAGKMQQADAEMQKLEIALEELKAAIAKTDDSDTYKFRNTYDNLNTFTGHWRELKSSKDPSKYRDMVESYNSAMR